MAYVGGEIKLEGFEELEEMLSDMQIDEGKEKKAMKKAIEIIAAEVMTNAPEDTTALKKSIEVKVARKIKEGTIGTVRINKFYSVFQEFGTSTQSKHKGFFERSVNSKQKEALEALKDELLGGR